MIAVEYLDTLTKASSAPAINRALPDGCGPFDRVEWWEGLSQHCDITARYLVAHDGQSALLLALTHRDGVLRGLANWYTFRWRPLASPRAAAAPLLLAAAQSLRRFAWRIVLDQVPDEDDSASQLESALKSAGWVVRSRAHDCNHFLSLAGRDYAAYLASRPGPLRTTLKRKAAKVACTVHTDFDPAAWAAYEDIYAASWKPTEGNPSFLRAFAEQEGAAGRLRLGLAHVDGRPVAAQLWTVEAGTAWIHKLAYREDAKAQSPGTVLSAALFAHVIDRDGVDLVDFGTGDDPYKRDWMDDIRPRYHIEALWPRTPRSWPHLARWLVRR